MTFATGIVSLILPSLLLMELPARADEIQVGTGLVCDTQQQVERFVALYDGDPESTVSTINAEEHNPTACGMVTMAYVPGPPLATARNKSLTFHIVQVIVVGLVTSEGVHAVKPAHFFSVVEVEELEA